MEISIVASRANSAWTSLNLRLEWRRLAARYPHGTQSLSLLVTPTPQPWHGCVHEPLQSFARWTLQNSPRQLVPQSSVLLRDSHWHILCPLGILVCQQWSYISNRKSQESPGPRGWYWCMWCALALATFSKKSVRGSENSIPYHIRLLKQLTYRNGTAEWK